jgi:hypothetical protein
MCRDAIIAIMELGWFCIGALKVGIHDRESFYELFSLLEKQKGSR